MTDALRLLIRQHLGKGYSEADIEGGIAYAELIGYSSEDEALSLTLSRILYTDTQLTAGDRVSTDVACGRYPGP